MPTFPQLIPTKPRKPNRFIRMTRAIWHDTYALVNEFRRPLIIVFFAVFVGGYVYGELSVHAGYPRLPYVDLPYFMLALMILESPSEIPKEWYLVLFWYLQPMLAVYIIGRGAADFIRLFFNRNERRDAWEVAVASTYRKHVIVVGAGHVGQRVIRTLFEMGFEVIAVDQDIAYDVERQLTELSVPIIIGDGRSFTTLSAAGLEHSRSLVVCTSNDHTNLEITMRARDANPKLRIITRMWDDRFADQLQRFLGVDVLSASDLAAPAFAGSAVGIEITQTIRIGGKLFSMIRLTVEEGSFLDGKSIDTIQDLEDVDIVLHGKNSDADTLRVHPAGDILVNHGDTLVIFSNHSKITDIVARNHVD